MKTIILSTIILIIFYIIYFQKYENISNNNILDNNIIEKNINAYLEGYWISDNNFLKLSDIDDLILFIDVINNFGYLIIVKNKQIIHNVEFTINFNQKNIQIDNNNLDNVLFNISFSSNDPDFIWSNKEFKCILSMTNGNLKLFNNDTLFGNLFKENKISYYLKNI